MSGAKKSQPGWENVGWRRRLEDGGSPKRDDMAPGRQKRAVRGPRERPLNRGWLLWSRRLFFISAILYQNIPFLSSIYLRDVRRTGTRRHQGGIVEWGVWRRRLWLLHRRTTRNVHPLPSSLSTSIRPPIASAALAAIAKPSPAWPISVSPSWRPR